MTSKAFIDNSRRMVDVADGGPFSLTGTLGIDSSPDVMVKGYVHLIDAKSLRPKKTVLSDTAGNFAFHKVRKGPWLILAQDSTNTFNAVVADNKEGA